VRESACINSRRRALLAPRVHASRPTKDNLQREFIFRLPRIGDEINQTSQETWVASFLGGLTFLLPERWSQKDFSSRVAHSAGSNYRTLSPPNMQLTKITSSVLLYCRRCFYVFAPTTDACFFCFTIYGRQIVPGKMLYQSRGGVCGWRRRRAGIE
jgi:hypothetical protein